MYSREALDNADLMKRLQKIESAVLENQTLISTMFQNQLLIMGKLGFDIEEELKSVRLRVSENHAMHFRDSQESDPLSKQSPYDKA
jgi:hypothetical protein